MSNIVTYPLNGIDYDARDAAGYTATRTSGVYSSEEDFAVTAAGGLSVTVSAGVGWVHPARFEGYSVILREAETLTLALADGQRPRIDRIVLRYDAADRKSSLLVLQGTPDTQPTAPDISRTALLYDLCLAQITRPAGSTTIVAGNITDTRLDPALCGVMRDGVTGIPTEELLASAREHINALEETASAAAKEANASKTAAAQSEANAKAYKEAAATSEHNAGVYADAAEGAADAAAQSENAAAGSATKASGSASAAEESKTAAATSEANAAKHEEAAKKAADEAGAKAGTDKTLSIENAPADAAVVGDFRNSFSPKTVTGSTIVCHVAEGYPLNISMIVDLEREGSGDVSLSNIRKIKGYDKISIVRAEDGKTSSLTFDETVASYSGIVSFVGSRITTCVKIQNLTGSENWDTVDDVAYRTGIDRTRYNGVSGVYSDRWTGEYKVSRKAFYVENNDFVIGKDTCGCESLEEFKTYLAQQKSNETPAQLAYFPLKGVLVTGEKPIVALSGANTLTASAGRITASDNYISTDTSFTMSGIPADAGALWSYVYPIGSLYIGSTPTSPAELYGGAWERIKDRFILAAGDTYAVGSTGGEATHTLKLYEMPEHSHYYRVDGQSGTPIVTFESWRWGFPSDIISQNKDTVAALGAGSTTTGQSKPHNNMPPYRAFYVWQRIA